MQLIRLLSLLLLFAVTLAAQPALDHARRAQAMLGPDVWSQLIRVENTARRSPYPRVVHALVFELAGILWFYTATDGTQSFSLHTNALAEEKADFAPLLRDIEPGFTRWTVMAPAGLEPLAIDDAPLPNGCFIESVAALRWQLGTGQRVEHPRLLSYYADTLSGLRGHTVLTYETERGMVVVDPGAPVERVTLSDHASADPLAVARALQGPDVMKARFIPMRLPESFNTGIAALKRAPVETLSLDAESS